MMKFKTFLLEKVETEEKLKHLEHPEDHFINAGEAGYHHAVDTLSRVHNSLLGKKNGIHKLTTKIDGAPSIVAGRHPETGKFFVGTKSVFNKTPKINYTEEDIDRNHGHAPGLAEKLKIALKHLPKVIHSGVHQGDYIHDPKMRKKENGMIKFKANTLEHNVKADSDEGKRIARSKMGIAFHTSYAGKDFNNMKAQFGTKGSFSMHPDVHVLDVSHDLKTDNYSPARQKQFALHMQAASKLAKKVPYNIMAPHADTMKQYINHTVRTGEKRTAEGYKNFLGKKEKVPKSLSSHVEDNAEHFDNAFKMHHHLENAKNALVHSFNVTHGSHGFTIDGVPSKPEGYVAVTRNNRPSKLVDRAEFSKANFSKEKKDKFK